MTSSSGLTWMASSKRSEAKIIQRIHHTKSLDESGLWSLQTNASSEATTAIGKGIASLSVLALFVITDSWRALSLRSSKSGRSIANRAATHFSDVFRAGMTEGHISKSYPREVEKDPSCALTPTAHISRTIGRGSPLFWELLSGERAALTSASLSLTDRLIDHQASEAWLPLLPVCRSLQGEQPNELSQHSLCLARDC